MLHTVSLKENAVFRRLYHRGSSTGSRYMVVYCRPNGTKVSRLGFTVSTKLGHAVVRNRIRRRLREIYRAVEPNLKPGYDLVVVARSATIDADFSLLERNFRQLCGKLELLL